jgi:hypothetical protein
VVIFTPRPHYPPGYIGERAVLALQPVWTTRRGGSYDGHNHGPDFEDMASLSLLVSYAMPGVEMLVAEMQIL